MRSARLMAAITIVAVAAVTIPAASSTIALPAQPANLRAVSVTETSITLGWGPSQPDPFFNAGEGKNSLTVGWGVSTDGGGLAVTYTITKDGVTAASGLATPRWTFGGLSGKRALFRTCAWGVSAVGPGPPTCATWNRQ